MASVIAAPCIVQRDFVGEPVAARRLRPVMIRTIGDVWNRKVRAWQAPVIEVRA